MRRTQGDPRSTRTAASLVACTRATVRTRKHPPTATPSPNTTSRASKPHSTELARTHGEESDQLIGDMSVASGYGRRQYRATAADHACACGCEPDRTLVPRPRGGRLGD